MNADDLKFSVAFVQWILIAVLGIYTWITNRQSAASKDLSDLDKKFGENLGELDKRLTKEQTETETRVAVLETQMEGVPTQAQFAEVLEKLATVDARLEGVVNSMGPLVHQLQRINDYLLNNK